MPRKVIVLKFGSSVLQSRADLPAAVHEIYRWVRRQYRVVAVVSAFAGEIDRLPMVLVAREDGEREALCHEKLRRLSTPRDQDRGDENARRGPQGRPGARLAQWFRK